jgi:hypothetical protein
MTDPPPKPLDDVTPEQGEAERVEPHAKSILYWVGIAMWLLIILLIFGCLALPWVVGYLIPMQN